MDRGKKDEGRRGYFLHSSCGHVEAPIHSQSVVKPKKRKQQQCRKFPLRKQKHLLALLSRKPPVPRIAGNTIGPRLTQDCKSLAKMLRTGRTVFWCVLQNHTENDSKIPSKPKSWTSEAAKIEKSRIVRPRAMEGLRKL